jgi:hypothetical protein
MTTGEVVEDVRQDALLRVGEIKGEGFEEFYKERALSRNHGGASGGLPGALLCEDTLHFEEFFAGEMRAGGFEFFP